MPNGATMAKKSATYRAWCFACGSEWAGGETDEGEVPAGEARAFCICRDCGHVGRASVRLSAEELGEYRRGLRKVISTMVEAFMRARARLEERRRSLRQSVKEGDGKATGLLKRTEDKLARLASPDVDHLERRFSEVERAEQDAPREAPPLPCSECGGRTEVCRETMHGYQMTCPRCGGQIRTHVG